MSLIDAGDTDLNEYLRILAQNGNYMTELIDGRYYSQFPLGVSLLVLPLVLVADDQRRAAAVDPPRFSNRCNREQL